MDVRSDMGKADEVMLPGFRFYPTEEELVGFYLKRKIQQKPLSIELIRELNIYKYDPWDLPKLAMSGDKEWYFYCPRDRKYRNSARPNRVTGAGFWKATGTDRPIYSSDGTKCVGLKKSLVFYKGRSAKGVKTDWMMHEFRLPSPAPNDSWAICRIFRKTISLARRAQSHSWLSPMSETTELNMYTVSQQGTRFSSENIPCTSDTSTVIQFGCANSLQHRATSLDVTSYKPVILINSKPSPLPVSSAADADDMPASFMFSPVDMSMSAKGSDDIASLRLDLSETVLGDVEKASASLDFSHTQQSSTFTVDFPLEINGNFVNEEDTSIEETMNVLNVSKNNQWGSGVSSISFPFDLALTPLDEWKPSLPWDLPSTLSEMPVMYPTNLCHTRVSL